MKFIITGPHFTNKYEVARRLEELSEDFSICKRFSTDLKYEQNPGDTEYINSSEITKAYKNNSFLVISSHKDDIFEGITIDNFYANNIAVMELKDFNTINENIFQNNQVLIVWVDSSMRTDNSFVKEDIQETKFLLERLEYSDYIYFLNDNTDNICHVIIDYYNASDEQRQQIIEKYC